MGEKTIDKGNLRALLARCDDAGDVDDVRWEVGKILDALPVLLDRIEELEQWKDEGLTVLDEWEQVYDMVPHPTKTLGLTKASVVKARITELESKVRAAGVRRFPDDQQ